MSEAAMIPNDFTLFRTLYELENIVRQYPEGAAYLEEIRALAADLESRTYRVAVIGEFKRGKSSMLNALLGASVLPTDILPMTATVNRIVYGSKKEILISYRDGRTQRADISELSEYVTKMTERLEEVSREIREVTVFYPSVFCQNHIELFDTPGLNDDDPMTAVTLSVLTEIDAAIVVISAVMPFSMTERKLILQLLEHPEIRNIVFVVTFIDQVSSRKKDQNRVIDYIRKRISSETMQLVMSTHGDDEEFLAKARLVLDEPKVFAVSSTLALKAFLYDDEELLEESRFPDFKYALSEVLTAAQGMNTFYRVSYCLDKTAKTVDQWQKEQISQHEKVLSQNESALQQCSAYIAASRQDLQTLLWKTDQLLTGIGIDTAYKRSSDTLITELRRLFIAALSSLRRDQISERVLAETLGSAAVQAVSHMKDVSRLADGILKDCQNAYERERNAEYAGVAEAAWKVTVPRKELDDIRISFPVFSWDGPLYPAQTDLIHVDIIQIIHTRIVSSCRAYQQTAERYLAGFRRMLLAQNRSDAAYLDTLREHQEQQKRQLPMQQGLMTEQHRQQNETLRRLSSDLQAFRNPENTGRT